MGKRAGELALVQQQHLTISAILAAIHPYPTLHTGLQRAAFEAYLSSRQHRSNRAIIGLVLRFWH